MKLKRILLDLIAKLGYIVITPQQLDQLQNGYSIRQTLQSLKSKKCINPGTIIDIGAAAGTWTEKAITVWPGASYIMFEPLEERRTELETLQKKYPRQNIEIKMGVAGSAPGESVLHVSDDLDGSGIYDSPGVNARLVTTYTLDEACRKLPRPYLLKLDTHGFEVPIFGGAANILPDTIAIIVEVYGFHISSTALRFHEMTCFLEERGFRLADMFDIMRRPKDEVFWQADFVFLRNDHSVFNSNQYN